VTDGRNRLWPLSVRTVTFYSYKGGTGRTLLLANQAVLAAKAGFHVVAIDFDLEAPGLPYKLLGDDPPRIGGLVQWLRETLDGDVPRDLGDYMLDVPIRDPLKGGGFLKLMPAGRAPSPNYFQDLERLQLDRRLDDGSAVAALLHLQAQLAREFGTDWLMLDARTGITATNAVTTNVLADDVVVLALERPEQLEGTRSLIRSLQPLTSLRTGEPLRLHVVLSRVPSPANHLGIYTNSDDDVARIERTREFFNAPAKPLSRTLQIGPIHLVHTDASLIRNDLLTSVEGGSSLRTVLHVDYARIGTALMGATVEDFVESSDDLLDPSWQVAAGELFARPDLIIVAKATSDVLVESTSDSSVGLEDQVDALRSLATRDTMLLPDLGDRLVELSNEYRGLGQRERARDVSAEAVRVYRDLVNTVPEPVYIPRLASALNDYAVTLGAVGQRTEALAAVEEAVRLYRELDATNPALYKSHLARSLNTLAINLGALGDKELALAASQEAVSQYRQITNTDAKTSTEFIESLNNLAMGLGALGRSIEALAVSREAVEYGRRLSTPDPTTAAFYLAASVNQLALRLQAVGDYQSALDVMEEAVVLRRQLAKGNSGLYTPGLPMSLSNLAGLLAQTGRLEEALAAIGEAVDLRRQLATSNPAAHTAELASSLNNVGSLLAQTGRLKEALAAIGEAVDLRRQLATSNPAAHTAELASNLNNLGPLLAQTGRLEEALAAIREAVDLRRQLAEVDPGRYNPDVSKSLNDLARLLAQMGRLEEGLVAVQEAVDLLRQPATSNPIAHTAELARSLGNVALLLGQAGRRGEAVIAIQEAVDLLRQLAASNPIAHTADLAGSLNSLSLLLGQAGLRDEAARYRSESRALRERLLRSE
jgi:MinD-like ATPase involved in chromosome partitioning or flagellar assembly